MVNVDGANSRKPLSHAVDQKLLMKQERLWIKLSLPGAFPMGRTMSYILNTLGLLHCKAFSAVKVS